MELFHSLKATDVFPNKDAFDDAILFIETAEVHAPPWLMEDYACIWFNGNFRKNKWRNYYRPQDDVYYEE